MRREKKKTNYSTAEDLPTETIELFKRKQTTQHVREKYLRNVCVRVIEKKRKKMQTSVDERREKENISVNVVVVTFQQKQHLN